MRQFILLTFFLYVICDKVYSKDNQENKYFANQYGSDNSIITQSINQKNSYNQFDSTVDEYEKEDIDDQTQEKVYKYELEELRLNVIQLQTQNKELQDQLHYFSSHQQLLTEQAQDIDILYSADHDAYVKKIGEQYAFLEAINELTNQIKDNKQISINSNVDLIEKIKQMENENNIKILAFVTTNLERNEIAKISQLFEELQQLIQENIDQDEELLQQNLRIHTQIRENIIKLLEDIDEQQYKTEQILTMNSQQLQDMKNQLSNKIKQRKLNQEQRNQNTLTNVKRDHI